MRAHPKTFFHRSFVFVLLIFATLLFGGLNARAQFGPEYDDRPGPGESFVEFFVRITRGGPFRGIRFDPPVKFQTAFLPRIARGGWVETQNIAVRALEAGGVDLWFGWYKEPAPWKLIIATTPQRQEFYQAVNAEAAASGISVVPADLLTRDWDTLPRAEREVMVKALIYDVHFFGGRRLVDFLADQYGLVADDALAMMTYHLLDGPGFQAALHQLGYDGPIYFRGLTAPDPTNPLHDEILLNNDLMASQSDFENPLYRAMETVMISLHETSHVFQDLRAKQRGVELSVYSPESVMVLEGMAEHLAENALGKAGLAMDRPNPFVLFAAEESIDVVYRPGNAQTGQLFPYTVGMPFAAALEDLAATAASRLLLRDQMLDVVSGHMTLSQLTEFWSNSSRFRYLASGLPILKDTGTNCHAWHTRSLRPALGAYFESYFSIAKNHGR